LYASIRGRFRPEDLVAYVPEEVKQRILQIGNLKKTEMLVPDPKMLPRLEEAVRLADLFGDAHDRCWARHDLAFAHALLGQEARALALAREALPLGLQAVRAVPHDVET